MPFDKTNTVDSKAQNVILSEAFRRYFLHVQASA